MSILATNKQDNGVHRQNPLRKTAHHYLFLSVLCLVVDNVYALFGHGVRSAAMSLMFLYPLLGGALPFTLLGLVAPGITEKKAFRPGYNLYNSGIAMLTSGSMLIGILEIAGTASVYTQYFLIGGAVFVAAGLIILMTTAKGKPRTTGK